MITATRVLGFSTAHLMPMAACPFPRVDLFFFHAMVDHSSKPFCPGAALTDTELIAAILAGDTRAFERLINQHKRTLFRTARAILRDDAEAVQEAFLQAYRGLGAFRGEAKLSTWLVSIAANAALMRRRRHVRASLAIPLDGNAGAAEREGVSQAPGPESGAARADIRQLLEDQIEALPDYYRTVFRLRAVEDLNVAQTAARLGISEATVRSRYFRARSLLREGMARQWDKPASLDCPILITERDRKRLMLLKPHAALLREIDRAVVISPQAASVAGAVTMNTQVFYTDETSGGKRHLNLVYPQQAGGCACCVSILDPVGTALLGLSAGQAIEWDFADGSHRLRVNKVVDHDCPINAAASQSAQR
jgi:RNA polymerase sigma-70 factor, ECF subfamily